MTGIHIGIIAEDTSDVEVLKILVRKLTSKKLSVSHFVGKGCGPLKRKTPAWLRVFESKGCTSVVLVHDLDRNDPVKLRATLEALLTTTAIQGSVVIIPTEELEAWLMSDHNAIKRALNLETCPKAVNHPETIPSPKERLGAMVRTCSKGRTKRYVNSIHNRLIAQEIDVVRIGAKCPSFCVLREFVRSGIDGRKT